jgi:glutathione S-transferase
MTEAIKLASESDRLFFEANPDRHFRLRPARDGAFLEARAASRRWLFVAVAEWQPGVRARAPFFTSVVLSDSEAIGPSIFSQMGGAS